MRVILLNGPPRAGKDTAARALVRDLGAAHHKFAHALKLATHAAFGLAHPADHYEDTKDDNADDFFGLTPRAAYIAVSERAVKPAFGREHFGRVLAARLAREQAEWAAVSDSGFAYEANPVVNVAGARNVLLMRIHRDGCTFAGDSRDYIELPGVATVDVWNRDQATFEAAVVQWARSFSWRNAA